MGSLEEISRLLDLLGGEDIERRGDVTATLTKLAEIFEKETEAFLKLNLDPFDDRHPSRLQPDCTLGHMLKTVFRNERIVDEMVKVYCERDNVELNTAVCRFLIDILPGLENVIFQEEGFVPRLLKWAEKAPNPLQSYATGLLAAAMDVPEIAANYREKNSYFVPLMLRRLHEISKMYLKCNTKDKNNAGWRFSSPNFKNEKMYSKPSESKVCHKSSSRKKKDGLKSPRYNPISSESKAKALKKRNSLKITPVVDSLIDESSNSHLRDFEHYVIGSYQVYPLTLAAQQRYILQYLTPMGEYQDLIGHIFAENALPLIIRYIDLNENHDVRLAFEALKYLASLLCHKKIAIEFLNIGGIELLLKVPYPSIAATGVSICFYYLSYIQEAMEKICLMPSSTVHEVVSYALWLLECSHDSSRCHATMFFGFAFAFRVVLEHFDREDGLRKLFNVMSTLDIFVSSPENSRTLSDDQIFANRQTARHVCGALKRYFEAHLIALAEESQQKEDMIRQCDMKIYKAANLTYGNIERNIEILHDLCITPLLRWKPVDLFLNLDGVTFLLELISAYFDLSYSGRAETVRNALDVLKICSLTSLTQLKFCDTITSPEHQHNTGISILLEAAAGEMLPVADIQRSALLVIINCVCSEITTNDGNSKARRKSGRNVEDVLNKIWKFMRTQNGIIILINLLSTKTPLTDADSIRALACRALCELSRSEHVKQIIGKLPLITDGILLDLIKEPVLQDKVQDHVQFCKFSIELIERVTGAPVSASSESSSVLNINKSEVVAKTKVIYHENELLQLICDHLSEKGFTETVLCLQREMAERHCPGLALEPCSIPASKSSAMSCPVFKMVCNEGKFSKFGVSSLSSTTAAQPIPPPSVPLKIVMKKAQNHLQSTDAKTPCRLQKPQICSGNYVQSPAMRRHYNSLVCGPQSSISLDSIVTEYLRKQHALCKNPMLACPPFDLFKPHNCPEARRRMNAPVNIVSRLHKRETSFLNGGYGGAGLNRKLIYSKFRLVRTYRDDDGRCDFTTCRFAKNTNKILIGTMTGALKIFNLQTAEEEASFECHVRGVANIETSEDAPLVITSDGGRIGNSSLWKYAENFDLLYNFYDVCFMEFAKQNCDRMIGTKHDAATIYDTSTFQEIHTFRSADLGNNYSPNVATMSFCDELILSDGLLFDVRSGDVIHKLDKFNSNFNGVFHPNGREIIANSEIWDLRTYHLLRTVPLLDQCRVSFNLPVGSVMYGVAPNKRDSLTDNKLCCFYTFDSYDYNSIATIDVKKPIFQVTPEFSDRYVATIEYQGTSINDPFLVPIPGVLSVCKLYEIGRTTLSKEEGDEDGEESEDSEDETEEEDEIDEEDNEGQNNDATFDIEPEPDDDNWIPSTDSTDDEALFSLNTSMED